MNEREISLVSEWNTFVNNENFSLIEKPPTTRELKEPELYLKRDLSTGSKHM